MHCLGWCHMDVSENSGFSPQIIHSQKGFSIIFTIHFGVPPFLGNTHLGWCHITAPCFASTGSLGVHPNGLSLKACSRGAAAEMALQLLWGFPRSRTGWVGYLFPLLRGEGPPKSSYKKAICKRLPSGKQT